MCKQISVMRVEVEQAPVRLDDVQLLPAGRAWRRALALARLAVKGLEEAEQLLLVLRKCMGQQISGIRAAGFRELTSMSSTPKVVYSLIMSERNCWQACDEVFMSNYPSWVCNACRT